MLYREPKLLKDGTNFTPIGGIQEVSVLYREPKLLKVAVAAVINVLVAVSVLYREPKLLKGATCGYGRDMGARFQCSTVSRNC